MLDSATFFKNIKANSINKTNIARTPMSQGPPAIQKGKLEQKRHEQVSLTQKGKQGGRQQVAGPRKPDLQ